MQVQGSNMMDSMGGNPAAAFWGARHPSWPATSHASHQGSNATPNQDPKVAEKLMTELQVRFFFLSLVLNSIVWYCMILHSKVWYCMVSSCIVRGDVQKIVEEDVPIHCIVYSYSGLLSIQPSFLIFSRSSTSHVTQGHLRHAYIVTPMQLRTMKCHTISCCAIPYNTEQYENMKRIVIFRTPFWLMVYLVNWRALDHCQEHVY